MATPPPGIEALADALRRLGWVSELLVGGSAATGDHVPGVSDLDLVAVTRVVVDRARQRELRRLHAALDAGPAAGCDVGCAYVHEEALADERAAHPTWTHGRLVRRQLSGLARAELVRCGWAVFGRPPRELLAPVSDDDVRRAARAELTGYWARAAARPWWWLDPVLVDLGLTSMARGRHALATGQLMTKTDAIDVLHAPERLRQQVGARRRGERVTSPRLRSGWTAWRDAARTTAAARRRGGPAPRSL